MSEQLGRIRSDEFQFAEEKSRGGGEGSRGGWDVGDASAGCAVSVRVYGLECGAGAGRGRRAVLFTDGRYTAQAKAEAVGTKVVIAKKPAVVAACEWMEAAGVRRCGFDAAQTTVAALETMRKAVSAKVRRGMFVAVGSLVARLREVKDRDEIARMRAAAQVGCELFDGMLDLSGGGADRGGGGGGAGVCGAAGGAEGMSFETIVASGERSALPHGRATTAKLPKRGFVTLDFGVILDGYCSDMTRTVHMGKALPGEREVYDSVLEAQEAAVAVVAPGVTAGEVDEAARSVLRRAGLDQIFQPLDGARCWAGDSRRAEACGEAKAGAGAGHGDYNRAWGVYAGTIWVAD